MTPAERSAVEPAPTSVLDLVNRTLADPGRTDNAMKIMASVSQGAASVILRIGIVGVVGIVLVGVLIHFSGFGPAMAVRSRSVGWVLWRAGAICGIDAQPSGEVSIRP